MSYSRIEEIERHRSVAPAKAANGIRLDDIVLDNIAFKYPGCDSYVIENAKAIIPIGKTTAIVGESGCGKSSLVKLLLKFYDPSQGRISIGGSDISDINENDWLSCCGAVMQNGYIFSGSIAENIAINSHKPDMKRIEEAARMACLSDFVSTLPMGYNTSIGATGIELSGGQKQRLMIARAIYKNPEILILDEATSSLDANNEARILDNIKKSWKGRTMIIIAHRLSTIMDADQILFMENGTITESGDHMTLLSSKGGYHSLVKKQMPALTLHCQ